jgi:arylformamidase
VKIHDITLPITRQMVTWPGGPRPSCRWIARVGYGDPCNESVWTLGAHTGTHVDAPSHFLTDEGDIEGVAIDRLVGPARVFDLSGHDGTTIGPAQIEALDLGGVTRALLKTSNSRDRLGCDEFDTGFCSIGPDAAQALVTAGVRTVGIDYLSVERFVPEDEEGYEDPVHHTLLGAKLALLEGIDLRAVEAGDYLLCALPLKLVGAEAAPARAVLIEAPGLTG